MHIGYFPKLTPRKTQVKKSPESRVSIILLKRQHNVPQLKVNVMARCLFWLWWFPTAAIYPNPDSLHRLFKHKPSMELWGLTRLLSLCKRLRSKNRGEMCARIKHTKQRHWPLLQLVILTSDPFFNPCAQLRIWHWGFEPHTHTGALTRTVRGGIAAMENMHTVCLTADLQLQRWSNPDQLWQLD